MRIRATPPPAANIEAGFTLLEMMVALMIFGLIAAAGLSLLTFSVRAQEGATRQLALVADDQRMESLLTSDLAQAVPRITRDAIGASIPAFVGTNGVGSAPVLHYVRGGWSNPDGQARASIQRVEVVVADGRLERRSAAMTDGGTPGLPVVLATNVESIGLRYRYKGLWMPVWSNPDPAAMPRAIELIVKRTGQPALMMAFLVGSATG